jgi:hypothetical protein
LALFHDFSIRNEVERRVAGLNMDMKGMSKLVGQFAMVGQLGLSLIMPLLMCLFVCYLLTTRVSAPGWVYIPGFIMGLGSSWMTAYKVYLSVTKKEEKKKLKRGKDEVNFNRHI